MSWPAAAQCRASETVLRRACQNIRTNEMSVSKRCKNRANVVNHGLGTRNTRSIAPDVMQCNAKLVDVLDRDRRFLPCWLFAIFIIILGMRVLLLIDILIPVRIEQNGEGTFYGGLVFFLDVRHHYILARKTSFSSSTAAFGFELWRILEPS
jgi:hypothetical protein